MKYQTQINDLTNPDSGSSLNNFEEINIPTPDYNNDQYYESKDRYDTADNKKQE